MGRRRFELSDEQFEEIEDLLPEVEGRGRPYEDPQTVGATVFFGFCELGRHGETCPTDTASGKPCATGFGRRPADDKKGRICRDDPDARDDHSSSGLGNGRGGFSSKIRLACDGWERPLAAVITGGQRHEAAFFEPFMFEPPMDQVRVMQPTGRPRTRPAAVAGDKAYDDRWIRQWCLDRDIESVIPA